MGEEPLSKKEYVGLTELVEELKETCSGIATGGKELAEGMKNFKNGLKRFFVFMRLMVKRDFKSSTDMSFDEWIEFGNKLSELFEDITTAVQQVHDCHSESNFEKIPETINELDRAAAPFINDCDSMMDSLAKLQKYSAEGVTGIQSISSAFLSDEEKQTIANDLSKTAVDLKKLISSLEEAKMKILDIKRFK